jgi:NADH:ubiquinone oxidoreductase subunit 6 (subunit J)
VLRGRPMTEFLAYAFVPIAIGAVAVVLVLGLVNMMRGGSPHKSQKLMRLRVLLQFIAIIVIMLTVWAMGK